MKRLAYDRGNKFEFPLRRDEREFMHARAEDGFLLQDRVAEENLTEDVEV